jgi:glucan phosphorylase
LPETASGHEHYRALALAVRDRLQERWVATTCTYLRTDVKVACYLSAEFLENFFLFGLTAGEVEQVGRDGYRPRAYAEGNPDLGTALELLQTGLFSRGDPEVFRPLVENLLASDPFSCWRTSLLTRSASSG